MNKKEARSLVTELLTNGNTKTETFRQLAGKGVSDIYVAGLIASYADPKPRHQHRWLINTLLVITFVEIILAGLIGLWIALKISLLAGAIAAAPMAAMQALIFVGLVKSRAWAYNTTILFFITQVPRQLMGHLASPTGIIVFATIGITQFLFTWYVRKKLFPDFLFLAQGKVKDTYVFTS